MLEHVGISGYARPASAQLWETGLFATNEPGSWTLLRVHAVVQGGFPAAMAEIAGRVPMKGYRRLPVWMMLGE